jgi:hypothetical protein
MIRRTLYRATRYVTPFRVSRIVAGVVVGWLCVCALFLALSLSGV